MKGALLPLCLLGPVVAQPLPAAPPLDVPPTATQKPYSPADGQVVEVNPPPFIWVPAGKEAVYALQLSRWEDFPERGTLTFRGLRRSVFVPHATLPSGQWFWRYGVETPQGVVYGRPRPFTIPEDARPFPFPDFDEVIRRLPKERPRLFFPGERLQQVRAWTRGELKEALGRLLRSCEAVLGEELVPEPPLPKSGPEQVRIMRTTRPPMDAMERCALAYLLTGEKRFGVEAKRRLLHFFSWDPEGPTGLFGYDEPAMWMMMRGVRAYDWTYDLFTPEERAFIEPKMKVRARQFLTLLQRRPFESNPYESHAGRLPGFLGETALCFAHEWPEAKEWLEYATLLYFTSYPAWGGDDGGWQEGPSYWGAYMGFALHFVVALRAATGVDLMQKPFFRNTPYYALYTATPYHEHMPFGDGHTGSPKGLGLVMYAFSTLTGNPYFRWYAEEAGFRPGGDVLSLATYDPTLKARSPRALPQARHFPAVGLVSMHTALGNKEEDISFLLRSSPYGSVSHGHADQNAFVIEAFGRGLAIATGYYPWYGSPHHHHWTRATKAVNSLLVNGEGQVRRSWEAKGEITAFHPAKPDAPSSYDYAEGEAAPAYGGLLTRFRRRVVHVRPGIFVMEDDVEAPKPSTFQWLLHAYERMQVDEGRGVVRIQRTPAAMEVHLLLPQEVIFSQTDQYDPPPELERWEKAWHLTVSTTQPSRTVRFLSVFLPHRIGQEATLPRVEFLQGQGAVGVRLLWTDGRREIVAFRTDASLPLVSCGGVRSDGRVFAMGQDAQGRPLRTLVVEGAHLVAPGGPGKG